MKLRAKICFNFIPDGIVLTLVSHRYLRKVLLSCSRNLTTSYQNNETPDTFTSFLLFQTFSANTNSFERKTVYLQYAVVTRYIMIKGIDTTHGGPQGSSVVLYGCELSDCKSSTLHISKLFLLSSSKATITR